MLGVVFMVLFILLLVPYSAPNAAITNKRRKQEEMGVLKNKKHPQRLT